jgi:hypothetical protein
MDDKIIWSIVFVLFVVLLCYFKPNVGRIFLGLFYLVMAIGINIVNAFTDPQSTVQMGEASLIEFYRNIFTNIIAKSPSLFILIIALFEITMGLLILNKKLKVKLGLISASFFLVFITPFGYIQIPWLGIAAVQIYLLKMEFDKTFIEILKAYFNRNKK